MAVSWQQRVIRCVEQKPVGSKFMAMDIAKEINATSSEVGKVLCEISGLIPNGKANRGGTIYLKVKVK